MIVIDYHYKRKHGLRFFHLNDIGVDWSFFSEGFVKSLPENQKSR